jgi:DNA relaxase NicK
MDSPVTPTAQTLLNELVAEYKSLYSEYVGYFPIVHNNHHDFLNRNYPLDAGQRVRVSLQKMVNIEKKLSRLSLQIYKTNNDMLKEIRKANRKGFTKLETVRRGRPRKIRPENVDLSGTNGGGTT